MKIVIKHTLLRPIYKYTISLLPRTVVQAFRLAFWLTVSLSTFSTLTCCNGKNPHYVRYFSTR